MGKLRDAWQKIRDAAGLKQGYTKTSMGDALDKWSAALKAATGGKALVQAKQSDLAKAKDAAVAMFVAAHEYREKLAKEKNLKTFTIASAGEKPMSVPYYDYGGSHFLMGSERKAADPTRRIVAFLNDVLDRTYHVIHYTHAESALLKARPEAKAFIERSKDSSKGIAEERLEIDRKRWQGHRDGAGIKPGYTKVSVGDKIDAYLAATKGKKFTGTPAQADRDKMATAAGDLYEAAAIYFAKLLADPKHSNNQGAKLVIEDLESIMADTKSVLAWLEQD